MTETEREGTPSGAADPHQRRQDFQLGDRVQDMVTGFRGRITAKILYLHEPTQYMVENDQAQRWIIEGRLASK